MASWTWSSATILQVTGPCSPTRVDLSRARDARQTVSVARAVLEVVQGDITRLQVDAVVNAANSALAEGGGVCGAIFAAAGRVELARACARLGGCPPGEARATPGFGLPARWIIHTVGPVWHGGARGEDEILGSCYVHSLEQAAELGARSVAFPAISTGIFGFPRDRAARIAVRTLAHCGAAVDRIVLVAFDRATEEAYRRELTDLCRQ